MRILPFFLVCLFVGQHLFAQTENGNKSEMQLVGTVLTRGSKMPLEDVEISSSETQGTFYTDAEGKFEIPFDGSETWLTFTYPGYSEKEILYHGNDSLIVILTSDDERSMESEVASFFGRKVKYNNSAFEYISMNHMTSSNYTTPGLAMQGQFAGLSGKSSSGMPGEGTDLMVRGINSVFGSSHPLIILDGMPFYAAITPNSVTPGNIHNPLKALDVDDIQRIEVLKDGGSLYGIRGSGGLIIITTRQPESVNTVVNFSASTGMSLQPENIQLLNAAQHKTYLVNQLQNSGNPFSEILQSNPWISGNPSYFYYYNYANDTDWQDEIFRPARSNKFNVELEGGDEIARFAVMLGYLNQQGVVENTNYQRYSFRLNSNIKVLQNLALVSNIGFSYHISDMNNFGTDKTLNPISAALAKGPMFGPYLRDNLGNRIAILSDADEYGFSNPAAIITNSLSISYESNFSTNLKLLYQPAQNVNILNITHIYFNIVRDNSFIPDYGITDFAYGERYNTAVEGVLKNYALANESRIEIKQVQNGDHFLETQGGLRISSNTLTYNTGTVFNTPTDEFRSLSSVSLVENTYINGLAQTTNYSDLFLNNNYRFKDKYLIDLVLTLSASSNTGNEADALNLFGGKWGFFPSLHAGWILSSEPFLSSVDALDLLKFRASYSVSGNDFYTQQNKYLYVSRTYALNSGMVRPFIPNEQLKWETVNQLNTGLDIVLFKEILSLGMDLYSRITNDLLVYKELPAEVGFDHFWENNGKLKSTGMELTAELFPINGNLKVKMGGNLSISKSVVEIDHDILLDIPGGTVIIRNGETPFSFLGLQTDGVYGSSTEALNDGFVSSNGTAFQSGDVKFIDHASDNIINENDRIIIGNLYPNMSAGIYISIGYRGLSIYARGDYLGGNQLFNYTRMNIESLSGLGNQSIAAEYAWKNENDQTAIPKISYEDPQGNAAFSDRWIEPGDFMRLREVTLSYDLPKTKYYNRLSIYVSGQNLLTHAQYLGYYPEFSYATNPALEGTDYGQIPLTPQFMAGIKVGF
jgi:TonB-linked SusC/RagA family outer membrane protein